MLPNEMALAFLLLTAPVGLPETPPDLDRWPTVQASVQKLAIDWEILDPRETRYILAKPEEFGIDINLLRRRHQELRDVPKLADAERLPNRHVAAEMIAFNRGFRKTLDNRRLLETDRNDDWLMVIRETEKLYQVWDAVRDARCDFYYVTVRRHAMRKLKDYLGEESWESAKLPPAAPVWRFAEP